jgi:uncharacterized protein (UPF0276 family)
MVHSKNSRTLSARPSIGLSYSESTRRIISKTPSIVDHIEVSYELLQARPQSWEHLQVHPLILHCASLSLAGSVRPPRETLASIQNWLEATNSPWLGEHIGYHLYSSLSVEDQDSTESTGYTLAPPMNLVTAERTANQIEEAARYFDCDILVENPPLYYTPPRSTLTQTEFIRSILSSSNASLLLDLTHLKIASMNCGFCPLHALKQLPLELVREVHVSGIRLEQGIAWDDHSAIVPHDVLNLLVYVCTQTAVEAITLEYNLTSELKDSAIIDQVHRVRDLVGQ